MTIGAFPEPARPPVVPGLLVTTLLGRGGHGSVWAAAELGSGTPVAVKVGHPGSISAPLASELALLCRIEHPHIVRLLRVVPLVDGGSAMVLELAAGGSLAGLVARRGTLSAGEVSTLLVPLAGALEHVHRRGLVHGDIAPGNVLFAADGRPMLGDLGTARVLGLGAGSGGGFDDGPWRTPGFEDPAGPAADPRAADVWGLAAVAWFALTGRSPGVAPGPAADHATASRAPMLVRLLAECLSTDPVARPEPADLARRAWDAARPEPVRLSAVGPAAAVIDPADALFRPFLEEASGLPEGPAGLAAAPARWPAEPAGMPGGPARWPDEPARSPEGPAKSPEERAGWPEEPAVTRPPVRPVPPIARSEPIVAGGGLAQRLRSGVRALLRALTHPIAVGGLAFCGLAVAAYATGIVAVPGERAVPDIDLASIPGSSPASVPANVPDPTPATSSPKDVPAEAMNTELTLALERIGTARAAAFAAVSSDRLALADEPGSPADVADRRVLARLRDAGRQLRDVSYSVTDLDVVGRWRPSSRKVTVTALAGTSGYRQVQVATGTATSMPAEPPRRIAIVLARQDDGAWLLSSIA